MHFLGFYGRFLNVSTIMTVATAIAIIMPITEGTKYRSAIEVETTGSSALSAGASSTFRAVFAYEP